MNTKFKDNVYPDEIANYLVEATGAPESYRDTLTDIIYNLRAICENERNSDGYRKFYDALAILATSEIEITAHYYPVDKDNSVRERREYFKGVTAEKAFRLYLEAGDNHDLAKYTPRNIYSIDTYHGETWND